MCTAPPPTPAKIYTQNDMDTARLLAVLRGAALIALIYIFARVLGFSLRRFLGDYFKTNYVGAIRYRNLDGKLITQSAWSGKGLYAADDHGPSASDLGEMFRIDPKTQKTKYHWWKIPILGGCLSGIIVLIF